MRFLIVVLALVTSLAQAQSVGDALPYDGVISIELHAPEQVAAGYPFNVRATLTNHGRGTYVVLAEMEALGGSHAMSYSHLLQCVVLCNLGTVYMNEGQSLQVDLGNYYYDAATVQAGDVIISPPSLRVLGADLKNHLVQDPDAESVSVQVIGPAVPELNLAMALPAKQALVPGDVIHDPNTGFDWLPLEHTVGMDKHAISIMTAAGGRFEGYTLATREQVESLLLNHLRAEGLNVRQEALYQAATDELTEALTDLRQWFGVGVAGTDFARVSGLIANTTWSRSYSLGGSSWQGYWESDVQIGLATPQEPACTCQEPGAVELLRSFRIDNANPYDRAIGAWLVRTNTPVPELPQGQTTYFMDTLRIPAVEVGGLLYEVKLGMVNPVAGTVRVLNIQPAEDTAAPVSFNEETGIVEIPDAMLITDEGYRALFHLTLTYTPLGNDDVFQVAAEFIGEP